MIFHENDKDTSIHFQLSNCKYIHTNLLELFWIYKVKTKYNTNWTWWKVFFHCIPPHRGDINYEKRTIIQTKKVQKKTENEFISFSIFSSPFSLSSTFNFFDKTASFRLLRIILSTNFRSHFSITNSTL